MKFRLKIRQKIIIYILSAIALLYIGAIGYIVGSSSKIISGDAILKAKYITRITADDVEKIFERELSLVRTLSQALTIYKSLPPEQWKVLFRNMYIPILKENPQVYSLWDSWEYKDFVPGYTKDYGRLAITTFRENNEIKWEVSERSMNGDPALYASDKQKAVEMISEPYLDEFTVGKSDVKLMISFQSPVLINGKFVGEIATDVHLENLQALVTQIKPVEGSYAFLVSNTGIIAGHPNKEWLNKNVKEFFADNFDKENIGEKIRKGKEFYFIRGVEGAKQLVSFAPIVAGKTKIPWSLVLSTPLSVVTEDSNKAFYISLGVGIFGGLFIVIILILIANRITKPIKKITSTLKRLADGEITNDMKIDIDTGDEIEEMAHALNTSVDGLNNKAEAATSIGNGVYNADINLLSDKDILGQSLINMRDNLMQAKIDEHIREEETKLHTWAAEGLAKFAEILRQNSNDIQQLSDIVIQNIVKYLGANQGGIFLLNDEIKTDPHFELMSAFAWDRKKYISKRVEIGEGLIGACAMEKETIFLRVVPDDYIQITSGLGGACPNCVVIVPLKHENQVLGVIELASFRQIEKYQVEFLESIGDSISSTLLSVKINLRTKFLLEQSQQQSEEMSAQEEEMRQNMEELQATQEEASRKAGEIHGLLSSLTESSYMIEYDLNGTITNANDAFLNRLGISRQELIGTHHSGNMDMTDQQKREYNKFWDDLRNGKSKKIKSLITWQDKSIQFMETYFPLYDGDGNISKVMKLSHEYDEFQ